MAKDAGASHHPSRVRAPVVPDEQLDAAEHARQPGISAVATGESEIGEQLWHTLVEHQSVISAGLVAERAGEPVLAEAGREARVEGLTKSVALEVGSSGIRVNAVAPGPIQTGMLDRFTGSEEVKAYLATLNAQKRIGRPGEIASASLYVSSEEASFMTGHILTVDGGKSAG